MEKLLEIQELTVSFGMNGKGAGYGELTVIKDLAVSVRSGEVLAIAGSSGSGKSILAHAILGLLPTNASVSGEMLYKGNELSPERQKRLRGSEIALIPQSVAYLDPLMRVGEQARGAAARMERPERIVRQRSVFRRLGLAQEIENLYPFQLSGGMARRALFSTAVIDGAELIIADEPTPGMHLDQAIEALALLRELADAGKGVALITHDIDLAFRFADRIAVFYAGTTLEEAPAADFIAGPDALRHPYSKALWRALPQHGFTPVSGFQPFSNNLPPGCLYAPRCDMRTEACDVENPPMRELRGGFARCIHAT